MDVTKIAYSSSLYYPEIIYNQRHVLANSQTLNIPLPDGDIPYIRIWGELYAGEIGSVWLTSAQYQFNFDYFDKSIYGYLVEIESGVLSILSDNPSNRTVYVRMYSNE